MEAFGKLLASSGTTEPGFWAMAGSAAVRPDETVRTRKPLKSRKATTDHVHQISLGGKGGRTVGLRDGLLCDGVRGRASIDG